MSGVYRSKRPTRTKEITEIFLEELEVEQDLSGWGGFEWVERRGIGHSK